MSYPYPGDPVVVCERLLAKIDTAKSGFRVPVMGVSYGDQDRIPNTPWVCVEPSDKTRELQGSPNMTLNQFEVYVLVYHNKVQDNSTTRKECDMIAYDIEYLLHQDLQLTAGTVDPYMIHGYVVRSESGWTSKEGTLYRSARLTYQGTNKTSLPVA